ncbi:MAG: L,D-transpeptidase family protein [Perlucidibaca sp.]
MLASCLLAVTAWAGTVDEILAQRLSGPGEPGPALRLSDDAVPQAVVRFYEARQWHAIWDDARYASLLDQLADLASDGLNPEDYGLSRLRGLTHPGTSEQQASRELLATRAYLQALLDLYRGRVDPVKLDPHWNFDMREIDPELGLQMAREAVDKNQLAAFFQRARPTMPQYNFLRTALARYRHLAQAGGWPVIPGGAVLKPGMSDVRVPQLRQRLVMAGLLADAGAASDDRYDQALSAAVQRFQRESYLPADGIVGGGTLRELNVPVGQRIGQLRANLERVRWFLRKEREQAVIVDLAGYRLLYMKGDELVWQSRVQIGRAVRQTPIFQSALSHVTLNPTWTVPPTILREDALPAIRRDRGYLARNHIRVLSASGQELSPASVNWANPGNITLRQDAGDGNSLGRMVIRFPNDYAIYLHDTPHKSHFSDSQRAFSSGCIRVENVVELGRLLLGWSPEQMTEALAEGKTRNVNLPRRVPVLIAYWTVDIGKDGYVSFKPDVYGQDALILQALDTPATAQK